MGCGAPSKPEVAHEAGGGAAAKQGSPKQGTSSHAPSRTNSMRTSRSLHRGNSGMEGRHGFVAPPSNRNSFSVDPAIARVKSEEAPPTFFGVNGNRVSPSQVETDHHHNNSSSSHHGKGRLSSAGEHPGKGLDKRMSITEGLNNALHALVGNLKGSGDKGEEDKEDGLPDLVLDVVFIFKKALEVKNDLLLGEDNLEAVVKGLVAEMDPEGTGSISRARLIGYVQTTCVFSNMVKPSHDQIVDALPSLSLQSKEHVTTTEVTDALLALKWGLIAKHGHARQSGLLGEQPLPLSSGTSLFGGPTHSKTGEVSTTPPRAQSAQPGGI